MWRTTWGRCFRPGSGVWRTWRRGLCSPPSSSSSSSSSSSQPLQSLRSQSEQAKRKRKREKAILSSDVGSVGIKWSEKEKISYTAAFLPGEKKDTTLPLPQSYSPEYVESCWYQWWEQQGFFSPEKHSEMPHAVDEYFSLCIPPPNVTGTLHLGHALTVAIEDALARWRRMRGYRVLWVPGCDHAGIATQSVVERRLLQEHGKRRQDYSREEFLQEVWRWKNEKGDEIYRQLKKLGASLDWSRACFTMDASFSNAVTEAFVRMCDSGLIYRSESLVNWSCALESAISDIEVDSKQLSGRTLLSVPGYQRKVEFGTMVTFAYPIEGQQGEVAVSTTRPETMLGDVAIAVHPDDPRYQALHGKQCRHPFTDRLLPIITDTMVDMELGTGAVKLTPAHDHTDFRLSQRHSLPRLAVIGGDGAMTSVCGQWLEGVKRFEARERVISALMERKLFRGKRDHAMSLPICSRSGDVIEPLLKKQWFVRCEEMAQKAIQVVDDGELEIIPHFYTKTWKNWLANISDWCISRQLWWGHQIPAYRVTSPLSPTQEEQWVWGRNESEARERAAVKCGVDPTAVVLTRDPDVLDTWFSSGLFPFAMLGWPEQTEDLKEFYPNTILETGSDLIFFWVARMVMLGTELTGQLPFKQVLFHSLVRDKHGRKMSKSLGNVIDPLDVISGVSLERLQENVMEGNLDARERAVALEAQRKDFPKGIPECGTDALRFALCSYKAQGEDISMSVSQVLSCRHFCNKMWQTVRFTLGSLLDTGAPPTPLAETFPASRIDRWICSRLYSTVVQCDKGFESYELHTVTSALHSFWLHSLCDVYLECIKPVLKQDVNENEEKQIATAVLYHCVSISLRLLSPFMPFLTEELWQRLQPYSPNPTPAPSSVCVQPYPTASQLGHWHFPEEETDFPLVQEVVRVARSLRAQCHMTKERPDMWAVCTADQAQTLHSFSHAICILGRITNLYLHCPQEGTSSLSFSPAPPPHERSTIGVTDHSVQLHLDVQSCSNNNKQTIVLSERREKLLIKLEQFLSRTRVPNYTEKVPDHVRQETGNKIAALEQELKSIEKQLLALEPVKKDSK
ncbi:valine--tRNA ligase, mitochondrial [Ictalurus furcatus]|uniref:valine--tRNA ligase, mitochondrial n=1 Tax=Ictalurus furcatus TaxID=66913 RepID=UPI002350F4FC|nr:valine--tRNA ligase, mitochondrial [Ictalurus furcatus]XP_053493839.1 valine--tRNA ligase, mitochondrial [Ictalurus furcatus]XP_053493840.1 valine--tRNA ligase, mitochondrial [Ictalurus furcatus]